MERSKDQAEGAVSGIDIKTSVGAAAERLSWREFNGDDIACADIAESRGTCYRLADPLAATIFQPFFPVDRERQE